jgi:hypothetical protein
LSIIWIALKLSLAAPVLAIADNIKFFNFNKLRQLAAYLLWLIPCLAAMLPEPPGLAGTALAFDSNGMSTSILLRTAAAATLVMAALCLSRSPAEAQQDGLPTDMICERHIAEAERALDIPTQLLQAIGLVESGVWNEARARSVAWPWTVYAQKRGRRFASKAEAVVEVRRLYNLGVRNIDVGCMQVNLHYHGQAFDSLEEAFDPTHNVAYAALLLKSLYRNARSWSAAIARYHSWTPGLARKYHNKVKNAWTTARRVAYEDRRLADQEARRARRAAQAERKRLRNLARAG